MWDSAVVQAYGNDKGLLGGLTVKNLKTDQTNDVEVRSRAQDWCLSAHCHAVGRSELCSDL